jgi:hypothetical protein
MNLILVEQSQVGILKKSIDTQIRGVWIIQSSSTSRGRPCFRTWYPPPASGKSRGQPCLRTCFPQAASGKSRGQPCLRTCFPQAASGKSRGQPCFKTCFPQAASGESRGQPCLRTCFPQAASEKSRGQPCFKTCYSPPVGRMSPTRINKLACDSMGVPKNCRGAHYIHRMSTLNFERGRTSLNRPPEGRVEWEMISPPRFGSFARSAATGGWRSSWYAAPRCLTATGAPPPCTQPSFKKTTILPFPSPLPLKPPAPPSLPHSSLGPPPRGPPPLPWTFPPPRGPPKMEIANHHFTQCGRAHNRQAKDRGFETWSRRYFNLHLACLQKWASWGPR